MADSDCATQKLKRNRFQSRQIRFIPRYFYPVSRSRELEKREHLLSSLLLVDGAIKGGLRWKVRSGHHPAGTPAGNDQGSGYWQVTIRGIKLKSSRVVWIITNGQIPDGKEVDHKDGQRWNNDPGNLQLLGGSINRRGYNKLFSRNTSGYMGVSYDKSRRKWNASLKRDGKSKTLGRFNTAENAARRYNEAVIAWAKEHGETPRYLNPV